MYAAEQFIAFLGSKRPVELDQKRLPVLGRILHGARTLEEKRRVLFSNLRQLYPLLGRYRNAPALLANIGGPVYAEAPGHMFLPQIHLGPQSLEASKYLFGGKHRLISAPGK